MRYFIIFTTIFFHSCTFFETPKEKLDKEIEQVWDTWKRESEYTTRCILDFNKIIPIEWDTMVYLNYIHSNTEPYKKNEEIEKYMDMHGLQEKKRYNPKELHFLNNEKIVCIVDLFMVSDKAKGMYMCTDKNFIKRGKDDAKFHLVKEHTFFVIRDTTEAYIPMRSYTF